MYKMINKLKQLFNFKNNKDSRVSIVYENTKLNSPSPSPRVILTSPVEIYLNGKSIGSFNSVEYKTNVKTDVIGRLEPEEPSSVEINYYNQDKND